MWFRRLPRPLSPPFPSPAHLERAQRFRICETSPRGGRISSDCRQLFVCTAGAGSRSGGAALCVTTAGSVEPVIDCPWCIPAILAALCHYGTLHSLPSSRVCRETSGVCIPANLPFSLCVCLCVSACVVVQVCTKLVPMFRTNVKCSQFAPCKSRWVSPSNQWSPEAFLVVRAHAVTCASYSAAKWETISCNLCNLIVLPVCSCGISFPLDPLSSSPGQRPDASPQRSEY